jgi:hypothetical protein
MKILKLAIVFLMTAWVSSANASLILDFEVNDSQGNALFTGEIRGLFDDATGPGTILIQTLDGNPVSLLFDPNFVAPFVPIVPNESSFQVSRGSIVSFDTLMFTPSGSSYYRMDLSSVRRVGNVGDTGSLEFFFPGEFSSLSRSGVFSSRLRSVPPPNNVPTPGTFILLALGVAGLACARYKKNV